MYWKFKHLLLVGSINRLKAINSRIIVFFKILHSMLIIIGSFVWLLIPLKNKLFILW
jgi:hypothetical protein